MHFERIQPSGVQISVLRGGKRLHSGCGEVVQSRSEFRVHLCRDRPGDPGRSGKPCGEFGQRRTGSAIQQQLRVQAANHRAEVFDQLVEQVAQLHQGRRLGQMPCGQGRTQLHELSLQPPEPRGDQCEHLYGDPAAFQLANCRQPPSGLGQLAGQSRGVPVLLMSGGTQLVPAPQQKNAVSRLHQLPALAVAGYPGRPERERDRTVRVQVVLDHGAGRQPRQAAQLRRMHDLRDVAAAGRPAEFQVETGRAGPPDVHDGLGVVGEPTGQRVQDPRCRQDCEGFGQYRVGRALVSHEPTGYRSGGCPTGRTHDGIRARRENRLHRSMGSDLQITATSVDRVLPREGQYVRPTMCPGCERVRSPRPALLRSLASPRMFCFRSYFGAAVAAECSFDKAGADVDTQAVAHLFLLSAPGSLRAGRPRGIRASDRLRGRGGSALRRGPAWFRLTTGHPSAQRVSRRQPTRAGVFCMPARNFCRA
jgi:hypothetical protein